MSTGGPHVRWARNHWNMAHAVLGRLQSGMMEKHNNFHRIDYNWRDNMCMCQSLICSLGRYRWNIRKVVTCAPISNRFQFLVTFPPLLRPLHVRAYVLHLSGVCSSAPSPTFSGENRIWFPRKHELIIWKPYAMFEIVTVVAIVVAAVHLLPIVFEFHDGGKLLGSKEQWTQDENIHIWWVEK